MTITTSRNKTYDAVYVDGPTRMSGTVMARIYDNRPLSEIAPEFEGLESFERQDPNQGAKEWTGYTVLAGIRLIRTKEENSREEVLVEMARP